MAALEVAPADLAEAGWRTRLPRLGNDRVILRELRRTDAPALYRLMRDPEIAPQMWPPPTSVEAFEQFIECTWRERAEGRYVCLGIVPQGQTDAAGLFELRQVQPNFFRAELGFVLGPAWWGTGLFSKGSRLLFEFAFNVLHVHRIEARVSVDNARSNAALRKIGAHCEGVLQSAFAYNGKFFDQNLWAIVAVLDEGSPSAPEASRSDMCPRVS